MKGRKLFTLTRKDFEISDFCSGGPGGQHQNRNRTGIRIVHRPSGAVGIARDTRSQHRNKKLAFERMAKSKKFQQWIRMKVAELGGETIDEKVDRMMRPENLRIEVVGDDGRWTKWE